MNLSPTILQGTGRYSIYVANYASGSVGPHALLEMDEAASDVTQGIIALSDVAASAGVNRLTGQKACWELEMFWSSCKEWIPSRGLLLVV